MEDGNKEGFLEGSTLIDNAEDKDFIELDTKSKRNGLHANLASTTNGTSSPTTANANYEDNDNREDIREQEVVPFSKKTILKNVLVGCTAFVFLFTAFTSVSALQTSLNREGGIGSISLALIYASIILSCFLPKFLIARLGCKKTMALSMLGYILYIAANFYAVKATMFTAAILLGMCAAPLWTAQFSYLTQNGVWYAKLTNQDKEGVISRFFGIFWLFTQSSQIWGNLVSSLVFQPTPGANGTAFDAPTCGAQFCDGDNSSAANFDQDRVKVFTALGIYVVSAIIALIIVVVFMDPIRDYNNDAKEETKKLNPRLLLATFKHLSESPIQMMLVVITIYGGMEKAFLGGVYTQAYISCSLGIWNLGYVMICFGVVGAVCSFLFGHLVKYIGRIPFFVFLFLVHEGMLVVLLLWEPNGSHKVLFFVFAGLWAMGSVVISSQLNSLYGEFFTENSEAAFSNFRLWEAVGFAVAYAYNTVLCTDMKIYVCMALLLVGMIGYAAAEVTFRVNKKQQTKSDPAL